MVKINKDYIRFMDSKDGKVTSQEIFEGGAAAERQRCLDIVNAAREGEIDGSDLRSMRHFVESGQTVEQIKGDEV